MMRYIFGVCLLLALYMALFFDTAAVAQCRIGSGPDHHDGVPWCNSSPQQPTVARPQALVNVSAAVAVHPDANDFSAVWDVRD